MGNSQEVQNRVAEVELLESNFQPQAGKKTTIGQEITRPLYTDLTRYGLSYFEICNFLLIAFVGWLNFGLCKIKW